MKRNDAMPVNSQKTEYEGDTKPMNPDTIIDASTVGEIHEYAYEEDVDKSHI